MPARASSLCEAGRFSEALAALAQETGVALPHAPDFRLPQRDPRQDMQYGESLMLCEDPKPYRGARRVLSRMPERPEVLLLSGIVETFLARFKTAEQFLDRAVKLSPDSPWPRAWRGVARALECRRLRTQEGLRGALADLDAAASGSAARFVYPWRAELRHDLEDMDGALKDLERILRDESASLWARVERGEILCETGRHDDALTEFDRLVRENPRAAWARALRGRTLATTGREAESLSDLRKAAALDRKSGSARAWLGESLRKLGRYAEALKSLDGALKVDPRFVLAWVWRGRIKLLQGKYAAAAKDLTHAIRLDPRYQLAFAWRGEALFKLGRRAQARRDFARVAPMDLARTWNPVLREGQRLTPEARSRAYEVDMQGAPA